MNNNIGFLALGRVLCAVMVFLCLAANPNGVGAAERRCYKSWSKAQHAVREHHLSQVDQVSLAALRLGLGQVVKATLCQVGKRYEYRLIVRDRNGQLRRRVTGARRPFAAKQGQKKKQPASSRTGRRRR